nr:hypothetical protein Itr_chr12CG08210 [Ipomoea trifida]
MIGLAWWLVMETSGWVAEEPYSDIREDCVQITEGDPRSWHFSSQSTPFGIELRIALSTASACSDHRGAAGCIICWPSDLHGFSQSSCCRFHGSKDVQKHKVADQISCCCCTSGYWGGCFSWQSGLESRDQQLSNCSQHK